MGLILQNQIVLSFFSSVLYSVDPSKFSAVKTTRVKTFKILENTVHWQRELGLCLWPWIDQLFIWSWVFVQVGQHEYCGVCFPSIPITASM